MRQKSGTSRALDQVLELKGEFALKRHNQDIADAGTDTCHR